MNESNRSNIKFIREPLRTNKIYALHQVIKNGQECYVKVFDQKIITKYDLDEALQFNLQILMTQCSNFIYPNVFLSIDATSNQNDAIVFLTKPFTCTLDQFIRQNPPQPQHQALKIFQQVLKAVYSLIMAGYWHRNLRAQHFVRVGNTWKLQSVVFDETINKMGINSEYLYNSQYQPPQAYERPNFTQQQLDQRIVWDLGCLLIHILTGSHKLKNQAILQKFKGSPFSFKKLEAKIQDKLSSPLKQLLGQMCHYDEKKRITISKLISNGFFSKEVALHYQKHKESKKVAIFVGSSSSISQALGRSHDQKAQLKEVQLLAQNIVNRDKKEQDLLNVQSNDNKIQPKQKFKTDIQSIIEQQQPESSVIEKVPNMALIDNKKINDVIELHKNQIDKGQILGIGARKFQEMLKLFSDKQLGMHLVGLTEYALSFVKTMSHCTLAKAMNQNKKYFPNINNQKFEDFQGSAEYKAIKTIINHKKRIALQQLEGIKAKMLKSNNPFIKQKQSIKIFVEKSDPQSAQFIDIKEPYRKILKLSYDMIAECYTTNKTIQWARLGMYITYCLAIDKFYLPDQFQNNFKYFFAWSKKQPCNYVSLYDFQNYLDNAPRTDLVQNSRYIMQRFYEI